MVIFKNITQAIIWLSEHFVLQAILLALALSLIYPHIPEFWYLQSVYKSPWRAIAVEFEIAYPVFLISLAIFLLAGYSQYKQRKRQGERDQKIVEILGKIATKLGVSKSEIDEVMQKGLTVAKKRRQNAKGRKIK